MSDSPFNRSDRTVIGPSVRPNPGGRRTVSPSNATQQPSGPATPSGLPGAGAREGSDQWLPPGGGTPPPQPAPQRALILKRDVPVAVNDNRLLEAASPILLLLGRLRVSLMSADYSNLMDQVADAIEEFEQKVRQAGVSDSQARPAKYALCATADDIVQHIPSEQRHRWAQYSMLARFFGERTGGVRFFEELDRVKADPAANFDLLELMHACLALGFLGIHRTTPGGLAQLQTIQRNLYELLRRTRRSDIADLSPHWQGQSLPARPARFRVPFWAPTAVLSVLVFALFVLFRFLLSADSDAVAAGMASIVPEKVAIVHQPVPVLVTQAPTPPRPDWPPPQPRREETVNRAARGPTQLQRIRDVLAGEIAAQKVTVLEEGSSIIVLVGGQFDSASATVLDGFKPVVAKIAQSLAKEPGDILVTGHTDSVPIFTVRFPSNYELSRERAMAMAAILKSGISDPSRIKVEPKADTKPRYTNTTEEGRAGNRRVEISIPTEETLRKP